MNYLKLICENVNKFETNDWITVEGIDYILMEHSLFASSPNGDWDEVYHHERLPELVDLAWSQLGRMLMGKALTEPETRAWYEGVWDDIARSFAH